MKTNITIVSFLSAMCFVQGASIDSTQIYSAGNYQHEFVPGEFIVAFKSGLGDFADSNLSTTVKIRSRRELVPARKPGAQVQALVLEHKMVLMSSENKTRNGLLANLEKLRADPNVSYVEPNYVLHAVDVPNDPSFSSQWSLQNTGQLGGTPHADIDATEAWSRTHGNPALLIGVIDTGIDYLHPDLAANIWTNPGEIPGNGIDDDANGYVDDVHGYNFSGNNGDPMDDYFHGTWVSGVIAGAGNNGIGVTGVAWNAKLVALKFLDSTGSGPVSSAINAMAYANAMGISITNNSWGGGGYSQSMKDVIDAAGAKGFLFVAAAGNNSDNNDVTPFYPASYASANIISVAATDRFDTLASFSNYGLTGVDLAAPGVDIYGTYPGNTYATNSGTSIAAPHVAGAAALLKSYSASLNATQMKSYLLQGADPIASLNGKMVFAGRLNVKKSLDWLVAPQITYKSVALTLARNKAMTPDSIVSTGGIITRYSASVALPAGLVLDTTKGIVSGTPTVALPLTNYNIVATGPAGTGNTQIAISVIAPPAAPVLTFPTSNAINLPVSFSAVWSASTGVDFYHVQVSTDSTFSSVFQTNDSSLTTTVKAIGPLAHNVKYYWRVNARNAGGTSAWSVRWGFTTIPAVPVAPILAFPTSNSGNIPDSILVTWNPTVDAASYRLQVSTDSTFSAIPWDDSNLTVTSKMIGSLAQNTVYYWRVNAKNAAGTGAWSETWNFNTLPPVPPPPVLALPVSNAVNQSFSPTLSWNASLLATSYHVQLSRDSGFASLMMDSVLTGLSNTVGPLASNTSYYWRVNAANAGGTSAFSSAWKFTTLSVVPEAPKLVSPVQNAVAVSTSPDLTWEAVLDAADYRLQLATRADFGSSVILDFSGPPTTRSVGPLSNGTNYYWRVYARNGSGTSPWSLTGQFATVAILTSVLPREFALKRLNIGDAGLLRFGLPQRSRVTIRVFNSQGRMAATLCDETRDAGYYTLPLPREWSGGRYLLDFHAGSFHQTMKLR